MDNRLDDPSILNLDQFKMGEAIYALPEMLKKGREIALRTLKEEKIKVRSVAFLGMGGSAIAGDLIGSLFWDLIPFNFLTVRDYRLPAHLMEDTLYIAISYSGETEETISAVGEALKKGGKIIFISSGGKISSIAQEKNLPHLMVPVGFQPRAALGYLFGAALGALESLGIIPSQEQEMTETSAHLKELRKLYDFDNPTKDNLAKQLASLCLGEEILIFSSPGITSAAAMRWRTQINENSKLPVTISFFPELDHNEIVARTKEKRETFLILLRDEEEYPRNKLRIQITRQLMEPFLKGNEEIWSSGNSRLTRLFSLILLGDYLSYYLSLLRGVDPTPVEVITKLKGLLKER